MKAKTSKAHPLRIDELPCGGGMLGLTLCPGKKAPSTFGGPPWHRNLSIDIQAIVEWDAGHVISLMEDHEFIRFGVEELGARINKAGIQWHHLPIVDGDIPDERFEMLWDLSGTVIRSSLRKGERVLLHCRGGLGRTGTIAARLLVEFGEKPDVAIKLVRQVRHGTIEKTLQEEYICRCQPVT